MLLASYLLAATAAPSTPPYIGYLIAIASLAGILAVAYTVVRSNVSKETVRLLNEHTAAQRMVLDDRDHLIAALKSQVDQLKKETEQLRARVKELETNVRKQTRNPRRDTS